jgi:hypothetical protein
MPMRKMPYDEWHRLWFANPGVRADRKWIACDAKERAAAASHAR